MSIFCIGQSAYDITVPIDRPLIENQKYRVETFKECGGGPALNAACLCAMWGAKTQLVSRIGKDKYGNKLKALLREYGVGTDYLIPDEEIETPYSLIVSRAENASRTIFNFPGVKADIQYTVPKEKADVILSDGHEPDITLKMLKENTNAVSVADAGTLREGTFRVAQKVDYLVCSEDFAEQYTGKTMNLKDWKACQEIFAQIEAINQKIAVITLGERGLLYRNEEGEICRLPACQVQAVDTSGAGDIFHGAFAYGLYKKFPLLENLKQSSVTSALSVQKIGSQAAIPSLKEVIRARKGNKF